VRERHIVSVQRWSCQRFAVGQPFQADNDSKNVRPKSLTYVLRFPIVPAALELSSAAFVFLSPVA
jgi:hypothetical protein